MSLKRVVIVTGSSRGIGARLAIDLNTLFQTDTLFILIARDDVKLNLIKDELTQKSFDKNYYSILKIDFSNANNGIEEYKKDLKSILNNLDLSNLTELFVFYNHGTLELLSLEEAAKISTEFFQTNVISVWKFLAAIRDLFPIKESFKQYHINTSSKLAFDHMPSYSLYTSTRIARVSLFKNLALEHPTFRVLNYQPGPVYTDMLQIAYENAVGTGFADDYKNGKCLTCEMTVKKLLKIIADNKFESGSSIDYYDYE